MRERLDSHNAAVPCRALGDIPAGYLFRGRYIPYRIEKIRPRRATELHGPGGAELSMSPTVLGTVAGQIMGTAGYMAPEQIEGEEEIDARADLFAFGCLLYEMIGGKRAFGGESLTRRRSGVQIPVGPSPLTGLK